MDRTDRNQVELEVLPVNWDVKDNGEPKVFRKEKKNISLEQSKTKFLPFLSKCCYCLFIRSLLSCSCKLRRRWKTKETERRIRANDHVFNSQYNYAHNYIKTSKYSFLTFLPLNLFEQFQRLANFYFLCLMVLQLIPIISSLTFVTTAVPLVGVLAITAIKDAFDDWQRHSSDSQVNNRRSHVLREGRLVEEKWFRVQVGDVIRLENNQFVAADLLVLSTSEPNGLCYIETAELDGETNLKCRQCLPETTEMGQDETLLGVFDGEVVCEPPNNLLNKFEGTLIWKQRKFPLDNDRVLLRGCILRNTQWCYGLVVFAGRDTKLMQNSGRTQFKRTSIDRLLNVLILGIVFFLVCLCLFATFGCAIWEIVTGQHFRAYLPWDGLIPKQPAEGATVIAILVFFSYAIVLNTVVPISLYVSVEVIRLGQSFLINWDQGMYDAANDTAAKARTTTLNEELGQVQYVFSDKTGTLTQNVMTFNKCSVGGCCYGEILDSETGLPLQPVEISKGIDFSFNPFAESSFRFYDGKLLEDCKSKQDVQEFFRLLSLCHTVMTEEKNGKLEYQAQSPDESALVIAARNFGFVFRERTPNSITIVEQGTVKVYELLCILDFNNVRKRMSVILRHESRICLYCKGADSVIYERLQQGDDELKKTTQEHLDKFAGEGLRTLVLAKRDIDEKYFIDWKDRYMEAATSMDAREEQLDALYEEIEWNLLLVGVTAIEDKLQEGVPSTIANLSQAGIKIWVLTGDKQETAINIGYSCDLLSDELEEIFTIDGQTFSEIHSQLALAKERILSAIARCRQVLSVSLCSDFEPVSKFCLVIGGHALVHALTKELEPLLVEITRYCKSVICCRVTPLQKALVVELIKKHQCAVTLAIGDGANDVSMLKAAHIGVGISGQEGMQAVLAADYAIAQFRFLERLLLVHGRWSYLRMCKFLRYFFYKNFAFTLCNFWFAFFNGFSAQALYDPVFISLYNLFYTSLPVMALGIMDQDVSSENSILYPRLYAPGHLQLFFNRSEFFKSALQGLVTSFVLFFVPYCAYHDAVSPNGFTASDQGELGTVVATLLVVIVTCQITLDTEYWTAFNFVVVLGSLVFYFFFTAAVNLVAQNSYGGELITVLSSARFWFTLFLTSCLLLLPVLAKRFFFVDVHPSLSDRVRLKQRIDKRLVCDGLSVVFFDLSCRLRRPVVTGRAPSAIRRSRRSFRSGYAFSHQEGFGKLITSGKMLRRKVAKNLDLNKLNNNGQSESQQNSRSPLESALAFVGLSNPRNIKVKFLPSPSKEVSN